jgi:hypothetical protein
MNSFHQDTKLQKKGATCLFLEFNIFSLSFSLSLPVSSTLENRTSTKRFISFQFLNPKKLIDFLNEASAHRKAATYTNTVVSR